MRMLVFPCTSYNPSVYLAMHCVGNQCLLFVLAETKNRSQAPYIPLGRYVPYYDLRDQDDPDYLDALYDLDGWNGR